MNAYLFALIQGAKLVSELKKRLKKTPPEKRQEAMIKFDKAMKKAQDSEEESTKELEEWFGEFL